MKLYRSLLDQSPEEQNRWMNYSNAVDDLKYRLGQDRMAREIMAQQHEAKRRSYLDQIMAQSARDNPGSVDPRIVGMQEASRRKLAMEQAAAQRHSTQDSPSMTAGVPGRTTGADRIGAALAGAPLIAGASMAGGPVAKGIGKLGRMALEGTRSTPWVAGGAAFGAGLEGMDEKATPSSIFTGALEGGAATVSPLAVLMAEGLGYSPEAQAIIKPKGGNWLSGSVGDALSGLKRGVPPRLTYSPEALADPRLQAELASAERDSALNSWIEGPLTKYVKTRMASPEDEVRKLAEQGVLHVDPAQLHAPIGLHSGVTRQELGQSPAAKRWEFASDSFIAPETAGLFKVTRGQDGSTTLSRNPWLADLPNEATVYDLGARAHPDNLGFPHLIDELSNALNPESGLPRNLLLTPEAVQNMSMEKAVRRVHDINEWRAAKKIEANRALAEKASVVREYPHSETTPNPKGLRWVELKAGDLPEGYRLDKQNGVINVQHNLAVADPRYQPLADQLKYEGDTMGHCVGGYCDDVLSGKTRIFSLRDAKGEPHVTVEVAPYEGQLAKNDNGEWTTEGLHPKIVQIKGKQNRAPNEEYLPFVQDFVRNNPLGGQWSDVGDLQNTGMVRRSNVFTPTEKQGLLDLGQDVSEYLTPEDIRALRKARGDEGFASGGRVTTPNDLHNLIAELESA